VTHKASSMGWPWAAALAVVAAGCAGGRGVAHGFLSSFETEVGRSAPEIIRERDSAMTVLSTYYGTDRQPLDAAAVYASARHAARAYENVDQIRRELGSRVHVAPIVTAISGLQYYVFDEPDRTVVAIRGTEPASIRNWVADAVIRGVRDAALGIDVHEGFLLAARIVQASLVGRLDKRRPVHLTGHSLGGSIATVVGLRLKGLGYTVSVTTFGAPKITTFAAFANEPLLHRLDLVRIVNAGDVVYHFPPTMDATGRRVYAQFGREWILTEDGDCVPTNLADSLRKSAAMVLDDHMPDWSLAAHGMQVYLDRLTKFLDKRAGGD
jgi:triacylglycerol lipase